MKKLLSILGLSIPAFSSDFMVIGHRGASGYEPENTLRSFERAINMGVSMIELDVYLCASGEIVVIHDDTVDRTTDGEGDVSELSWEELKQLDAGNGQRIPLLSQVFNVVDKRVGINIEIKDPRAVKPVAQLIEEYVSKYDRSYDQFLISSFEHDAVREFKKICPQVKTGLLFEGQSLSVIEIAKKIDAQSVILDYYSVTKDFITDAHAKNIKVFAYTVNAKDIAEQLKSFGIDGIITDYPDILNAAG